MCVPYVYTSSVNQCPSLFPFFTTRHRIASLSRLIPSAGNDAFFRRTYCPEMSFNFARAVEFGRNGGYKPIAGLKLTDLLVSQSIFGPQATHGCSESSFLGELLLLFLSSALSGRHGTLLGEATTRLKHQLESVCMSIYRLHLSRYPVAFYSNCKQQHLRYEACSSGIGRTATGHQQRLLTWSELSSLCGWKPS